MSIDRKEVSHVPRFRVGCQVMSGGVLHGVIACDSDRDKAGQRYAERY
jgi:hypothetical protein